MLQFHSDNKLVVIGHLLKRYDFVKLIMFLLFIGTKTVITLISIKNIAKKDKNT